MTLLGMALHVVVGFAQKSQLGQVRDCFPSCGWKHHFSTTLLGAGPMTLLGTEQHAGVGCSHKLMLIIITV